MLTVRVHGAELHDRDGAGCNCWRRTRDLNSPGWNRFGPTAHTHCGVQRVGQAGALGWRVEVPHLTAHGSSVALRLGGEAARVLLDPAPEVGCGAHVLAWLSQVRRLSKDYERLPEVAEAMIYGAMSRLMLRRLAKGAV